METKERSAGPLGSVAVFLAFGGIAFRLTFSATAASFLENGLADVMLFCAMLLVLVAAVRRGGPHVEVNLASGAIIFLVIILFLAARHSAYARPAVGVIMDFAALGCLSVIVSGRLFGRSDTAKAAAFLVGLVPVTAAVSFFQYREFPRMLDEMRGRTPPFMIGNLAVTDRNYADFLTRIESREIFGTFLSSNVLAGFLALALPVTLGVGAAKVRGASGRRRIVSAGICALVAAGEVVLLVLTKSKGGLVAAGVATAVFVLAALYRLLSRRAFAGVVAAGAALAVSGMFLLLPRVEQMRNEARTSVDIRLGYWKTTLGIVRAHPIAGVGPGNFSSFYFQERSVADREVRKPHNALLLVWAEGGAFAAIFFVAFWVLAFAGPTERDGPRRGPCRIAAVTALPAAALLYAALIWVEGGLSAGEDLPLAVVTIAGSVIGAALVYYLWPAENQPASPLVGAGLAAGVIGMLVSSSVDVSFSDAGAATALVFAAAAISPRGKSVRLGGGVRTFVITAMAAVALLAFIWKVFLPYAQAETAFTLAQSYAYADEPDLTRAAKYTRTAMDLDPKNARLAAFMGRIYHVGVRAPGGNPNNVKIAEDFYNKAIALDALNLKALRWRAELYAEAGPAYSRKALLAHLALLAAYANNAEHQLMAAGMLERQGQYSRALRRYRRALLLDEAAEQHHLQLSEEKRAEVEESIERIEKRLAGGDT